MAPSVVDCEAMIAACDAAGVRLMIAYRLHFEEASLQALEKVRDGTIGDPQSFSSVFSHMVKEGDVRTRAVPGGGALFDLGPYCVNAARTLFGEEPVEVFGWQTVREGIDEMTAALLKFSEGRIAQFTVHQGASFVSELRITGTTGDLRLDPAYEYAEGLKEFLTVDEETHQKKFAARDQFAPELIYFAQCLLDGDEPEPSGEEGLCDVRVLSAIVQSAQSGKAVTLAPFERRQHPDPSRQIIKRPPVAKVEPVNAPAPSR
jgi:predicted dehydrogenase